MPRGIRMAAGTVATAVAMAVGLALVGTSVAVADGAPPVVGAPALSSPQEVVKLRQKGFKDLGAAFKTVRDELKGDSPDAAKIASAAAVIKKTAQEIPGWFPAGSGPQPGVKTDAKAEVWGDAKGFEASRSAFIREAQRDATRFSDPAGRSSWSDVAKSLGQACKDCHDTYRVKRE